MFGRHVADSVVVCTRPQAILTATHDNHEKIHSWASYSFPRDEYGAALGGPSDRRSSAITRILTHWHLELFAKIGFFDILVLLKLDRGQISFNVVENALVRRQLAVLVTRIAFKTFQPRHAQKSRKWPTALGFSTFENFFSPFLFIAGFFFFAAVIGHLSGLLGVKKDFRKSHRGGQFLPWSS